MIGILALQGGFELHQKKLAKSGIESFFIRQVADLLDRDLRGLIIPGGESSTMLKLLTPDLKNELVKLIRNGLPTFATCAGAILLASKVTHPAQESLELLDLEIIRNGYGTQLDSFNTSKLTMSGSRENFEGTFIRAPIFKSYQSPTLPLVELDGKVVGVIKDKIICLSFHPELNIKPTPPELLFYSFIKTNLN